MTTGTEWQERVRRNSFPLLRGLPVRLLKFPYGDLLRFRIVFRNTWRRIPLRERRTIARLWRAAGLARVEVLDSWSGYSSDDCPLGTVSLGGSLIQFRALVDEMPDDVCASLIAHELAHVALMSVGADSHAAIAEHGDEAAEEEVDELVYAWGFAPHAMGDWHRKAYPKAAAAAQKRLERKLDALIAEHRRRQR